MDVYVKGEAKIPMVADQFSCCSVMPAVESADYVSGPAQGVVRVDGQAESKDTASATSTSYVVGWANFPMVVDQFLGCSVMPAMESADYVSGPAQGVKRADRHAESKDMASVTSTSYDIHMNRGDPSSMGRDECLAEIMAEIKAPSNRDFFAQLGIVSLRELVVHKRAN